MAVTFCRGSAARPSLVAQRPGRRTIGAVAALHLQQRGSQRSSDREDAGRFSGAPSTSAPTRPVHIAEGTCEACAATLAAVDTTGLQNITSSSRDEVSQPAASQPMREVFSARGAYVPDDVIKEFEAKLQGDIQSVFATLVAGIGVITWWRGVWALLDHYIGDSVFGDWMCVVSGLLIILYIRFKGAKLLNFFPPS